MPSREEKLAIESNNLGLRVVPENGEVVSGSYYILFPVEDDWDERLTKTAETIRAASAPGKTLHLLKDCPGIKTGTFNSDGRKTFDYGRLVTPHPKSIKSGNLFGCEKASAFESFVMSGVRSLVPKNAVMPMELEDIDENRVSCFSGCLAAIAHVFSCCNSDYRPLAEEDDYADLL